MKKEILIQFFRISVLIHFVLSASLGFFANGLEAAELQLVPRRIVYVCEVTIGNGLSNQAPTCDQAIQPLLQYYIVQPADFRGCVIGIPTDPAITVFGSCYVNGHGSVSISVCEAA